MIGYRGSEHAAAEPYGVSLHLVGYYSHIYRLRLAGGKVRIVHIGAVGNIRQSYLMQDIIVQFIVYKLAI